MKSDGVILLGGAGFIGTALARRLAALGRRVHVISRKLLSEKEAGITFHHGDLSDGALLERLLPECGTIVHLASTTTPGSSARNPDKELANLQPALRLLQVLQGRPDVHLIFLSSGGTVYGNPARNPVAEDAPLAPLSYHGACKVAIETFLQAFRIAGHAVTVLRPSNTYGPGQDLRQGFGLIRTVLQHILEGSTMEIWGDGNNVRDFIYIDDVVDAILRAIHSSTDSGTYNVGYGVGHTLNQVVEAVQDICGRPLNIDYRPARKTDVREVVLDIASIHSHLGWRPQVDLREGIHRTWQWLQKA
jgi:UDP-glucose 4-epimerase